MSLEPTKRIRDPIHGLIVFNLSEEIDQAAWALIDTPEFQRLRRVKQLGVSEFTFPGATHTRFAHCIGVFHVARRLMKAAEKSLVAGSHNPHRMRIALLSALLHDLGHGPFSHAFEEAEKARLRSKPGAYKNHEKWTAEIITNAKGGIAPILSRRFGSSMAGDIAELLTSEPADIYAAVVSSSFDADRLDYLARDKFMSGSGAGGIDLDWLIDNLRVTTISSDLDRGKQFLARLNSMNATVLELAATIHWLVSIEQIHDWRSELQRRKGAKASGGRTEKAVALLSDLGIAV